MGWSLGRDHNWQRDIGYGVPAYCDHPECNEKIDRGLSYVCGGEPYGGEFGCGLFFCSEHQLMSENEEQRCGFVCERCSEEKLPFESKEDHPEWIEWKLKDGSWEQWRKENPELVEEMKEKLKKIGEIRS